MSQLLLCSDYFFDIGLLFRRVVSGNANCFGHCVATRIRIQVLFMLPYSKDSLISVRKLLGPPTPPAKINVIVNSAFKKLFEL